MMPSITIDYKRTSSSSSSSSSSASGSHKKMIPDADNNTRWWSATRVSSSASFGKRDEDELKSNNKESKNKEKGPVVEYQKSPHHDQPQEDKDVGSSSQTKSSSSSTINIIESCKLWNKRFGGHHPNATSSSSSMTPKEMQQKRREFHESPCGQVWRGVFAGSPSSSAKKKTLPLQPGSKIHLVISHCAHSLSWVMGVLDALRQRGYHISIHVYSKCGKEQEAMDMKTNATINTSEVLVETLPNVGGCDHAYATWLARHHPGAATTSKDDDDDTADADEQSSSSWDYVLFLKDTTRGNPTTRILSALQHAAATDSFGCGMQPPTPNRMKNVTMILSTTVVVDDDDDRRDEKKKEKVLPNTTTTTRGGSVITTQQGYATYSTLHVTDHVHQFQMGQYKRQSERASALVAGTKKGTRRTTTTKSSDNEEEDVPFKSPYVNLLDFASSALGLRAISSSPLTHVCYTGMFAISYEALQQRRATGTPPYVFERLQHALERGNNIEEGHFVERLWASFFQKHPTTQEVEAITQHFMDGVVLSLPGHFGILGRMIM